MSAGGARVSGPLVAKGALLFLSTGAMIARHLSRLFLFVLALAACGTPRSHEALPSPAAASTAPAALRAPAPRAEPSASDVVAEVIERDGPVVVADGVTVEAAKGWWVKRRESALTLQDPERGLAISTVVVPDADVAQAVRAAWQRVQADMRWPEKGISRPPPRDGWDEIAQVDYDVPPAAALVVAAIARRKGPATYVTLLQGSIAAFDKRGAQVGTVIGSLKTPDREDERFAADARRPLTDERLEEIAAFVEEARVALEVPGAALAVVDGGRVVLERGFGVKDTTSRAPVSPATRFMIGSTTKALTTLLQARAIDAGRARWDSPVVDLLPGFALADAGLTKQIALRDTACACTGMPRRDFELLLAWQGATPASRVADMKTWLPTTKVGETFQYSNHLVAVGGYAAGQAFFPGKELGRAYDDAMQREVFGPLGMTHTTFDFAGVARGDVALPHGLVLDGPPRPVSIDAERSVAAVRPAGAAWSTVGDMARYVLLELGQGTLDGKQVVSAAPLLERRKPGIKITNTMSYGLGLIVQDEGGVTVVGHGGNTLGFSADLWFLPEHGVGVVLLYNAQGKDAFRRLIQRRILEVLFGARESARDRLAFAAIETKKDRAELWSRLSAPDPAETARLQGRYHEASIGDVELKAAAGALQADFGEYRTAVRVRRDPDGKTTLVTTDPPLAGLELVVGEDGGRRSLAVQAGQVRYLFVADR